jgi:D-alanyl-D-alanine carboxypeptidase/D-alanyl-D-alanine-endopeptidase (penicillin-binding protein 4)
MADATNDAFVAPSATKASFVASACTPTVLGADHRFRTTVHRTGPVVRGVLKGDLVLVAGGDLLLGPRIRPDGTLALPEPDHSYGLATEPVPGDPLQQLRHLARQVARRGIRRVEGRVVVDASLLRQGRENIPQNNIEIPVSPMMVNDNVVDVVVTPGGHAGAPAGLRVWPDLPYVTVVNDVTTVANPVRRLTFTELSPGSARLTGEVRLGGPPVVAPYISPPLSEQVKVMLKLSSNVHTAYFPYLVGAVAGRDPDNAKAAGERYQRELFAQAGLDPRRAGGRPVHIGLLRPVPHPHGTATLFHPVPQGDAHHGPGRDDRPCPA